MGYYGRGDCNCYGRGRGDYYRGDYYRGDPGFFSSLGKVVGSVARIGTSLIPGPLGSVARLAVNAIQRGGGGGGGVQLPIPNFDPRNLQFPRDLLVGAPGGSINPGVALVGPGAVMNTAVAPGGVGPQGQVVLGSGAGMSICKFKGTHLNKAGYFRRTPGGSVIYVEKHSACVPNRRMNPCNGKALKRAIRRAMAFKRVAMKSINLVQPAGKKKKFGGFKTRRKR